MLELYNIASGYKQVRIVNCSDISQYTKKRFCSRCWVVPQSMGSFFSKQNFNLYYLLNRVQFSQVTCCFVQQETGKRRSLQMGSWPWEIQLIIYIERCQGQFSVSGNEPLIHFRSSRSIWAWAVFPIRWWDILVSQGHPHWSGSILHLM